MPTSLLLARAPVFRYIVTVSPGQYCRSPDPAMVVFHVRPATVGDDAASCSFELDADVDQLDRDARSERIARAVLRVYGIDRAIVTVEEPGSLMEHWPRWYVERSRS